MVIAQSLVKHDPDLATGLKPRLARNLSQLARITDDVQRTAMSMRMIPIGQLFQKTGRLVRDLSRKYGRQVDLDLQGEDTELDRNIVEELADPLMHMVRNAIDHGIEMPEDRVRAGKPAAARLTLKAGHQAGHIIIQVSDDGRGLDHEKILRKAREKKLIAPGAELGESEIFNLIFQPGFSTAEKVTDVSGRGVGMDVVRKQVQKLRGRVDASSVPGQGTSFLMKLPLTLAIIDGLVVGVGKQRYIVPIFAVREMLKPSQDAISTVQGTHEMALVRGALVPVVRLHQRFHVKPRFEQPWESLLIVSESGGRQFCLMVDELIGKQEVVIKSLGETMRNIRGVAGGAILGDGRVGLILDLEGLLGASHSE
jgi:two-component system chemotaxis sensor kinase CheA